MSNSGITKLGTTHGVVKNTEHRFCALMFGNVAGSHIQYRQAMLK